MSSTAGIKHWIKVRLFNMEYVVRLGDTVWFYPGCSMTSTPQVAVITLISEDHMVDLAVINTNVARRVSEKGVCLLNSPPLLDNSKQRDKGCWCPRTPENIITSVADQEG